MSEQPERPDAFISYAREDQAFVEGVLVRALRERGKALWVDLAEIPPATDWRERVDDGIAAARTFVFVLTSSSLASKVCEQELQRALAANKRLLPVLRDEVDSADVPPELERRSWVLMREHDDLDAALDRLVTALETDPEWLDRHAWLSVRAREWDGERGRLLSGRDLQTAERWLAEQGAHAEPASPLQAEYILASRQATTRRQRLRTIAVASALVVSSALGVLALVQRNAAVANEATARSRELATKSRVDLTQGNIDTAALLAIEAYRTAATGEARSALLSVLPRLEGSKGALIGATDSIEAIDVSADGATAASANDDAGVRLWDVAKRRQIGRLPHADTVSALAFAPDGRTLITASDDQTLLVWDLRTRKTVRRIANAMPYYDFPEDLAVAPDGRTVALAGFVDGRIRLFDLRSDRPPVTLRGHTESVTSVAFSPDGSRLASGSDDFAVRIWSVRGRRTERVLDEHAGPVEDVAFSPDGKTLASGSDDRSVRLWEVASGRALGRLRGHTDYVLAVAFGPGGVVASGGADTTVRLWDARRRAALGTPLTAHNGAVGGLAFAGDRTVVSGSDDQTLRLWETRPRPLSRVATTHLTEVRALTFRDARTLASADMIAFRLSDIRRPRAVATEIPGELGTTVAIAYTRDRRTLAYASNAGAAYVLDARTHRPRIPKIVGPQFALALTPDGRALVGANGDGGLIAWDLRTGKALGKPFPGFADSADAVAISPDGRTVAAGGLGGEVHLWDFESRRPLGKPLVGHPALVRALAFSPDGALLASASDDVRLWDVAARRQLGTPLTSGSVESLAFSPDGRTLASGGTGGGVRLWDVESRLALGRPLRGHGEFAHAVAFSPNGRTLAVGGHDGNVRLWDPILWEDDVPTLQRRVCAGVRHGLTRAQWEDLIPGEAYRETCSADPAR